MDSNAFTTGTRFQNRIITIVNSHGRAGSRLPKSSKMLITTIMRAIAKKYGQMICNFDRSSILAPNDLEDAETFLLETF